MAMGNLSHSPPAIEWAASSPQVWYRYESEAQRGSGEVLIHRAILPQEAAGRIECSGLTLLVHPGHRCSVPKKGIFLPSLKRATTTLEERIGLPLHCPFARLGWGSTWGWSQHGTILWTSRCLLDTLGMGILSQCSFLALPEPIMWTLGTTPPL